MNPAEHAAVHLHGIVGFLVIATSIALLAGAALLLCAVCVEDKNDGQ